ncbi:hypothetical protein [Salidesulfovibrio brasiliensis]|uniref:hypothetical protein n=1 Tax=Salidesulfovibrio brasiliensis TaxID=221711 RepID=UPI0006CFA1F8|nr:hypothetical protein [Salidesulfovibrio brasiliensis]
MKEHIRELYDKDGTLIGCLLTAEAWQAAGDQIKELLGLKEEVQQPKAKEPVQEWNTLKEYWDFPYQPKNDVRCDECGSSTEDWLQDEPRKFTMTSATLGGLVSYRCEKCRSRVQKKHFKDEVVFECTPYLDSKTERLEAKY